MSELRSPRFFSLPVVILLHLGFAAPASAYVRSTSATDGKPFVWLESCLAVKPDGRGSQDVPIDQINATLQRAVSNWTVHTNDCTYLRLSALPADGPQEVAADGQPVVVFRDQVWARPGGMPHDPAAIGLTTVFHIAAPGDPGDATILDADIELNGVNYTFTTDPVNATQRPSTFAVADLENTLTHELGHVQGLAHTCWDHITPNPPLDNNGNPIPDCNDPNLPDAILNTTMFPYATMPREISKRNLSMDDVAGICDVYPSTQPQNACFQHTTGGYGNGCALVPGRARPPAPFALLVLVAGATWLVRRRRPC
jgi:hypothetical protein